MFAKTESVLFLGILATLSRVTSFFRAHKILETEKILYSTIENQIYKLRTNEYLITNTI
jgi:hypothetical protein